MQRGMTISDLNTDVMNVFYYKSVGNNFLITVVLPDGTEHVIKGSDIKKENNLSVGYKLIVGDRCQ